MKAPRILLLYFLIPFRLFAQQQLVPSYWPEHYFPLSIEGKNVRMAYMDVAPAKSNGEAVILLHGKNFNGFYWRNVIVWLSEKGYRVIVPDQLGFGNSDFPDIHYSFHLLASNTAALLDSLHIQRTIVWGHSMGGMVATRFALMFPEKVSKLILEDPIGLEDYRTFVPYKSVDEQLKTELGASYEKYLAYQKSYYPLWKPEYDSLVRIQALALQAPNFGEIALANALTYEMIYQQPVCYEFGDIKVPTLLVVGGADRTIVGKAALSEAQKKQHGIYPELGRKTASAIPGAKLDIIPGVGHIPHIQAFDPFIRIVASFLDR